MSPEEKTKILAKIKGLWPSFNPARSELIEPHLDPLDFLDAMTAVEKLGSSKMHYDGPAVIAALREVRSAQIERPPAERHYRRIVDWMRYGNNIQYRGWDDADVITHFVSNGWREVSSGCNPSEAKEFARRALRGQAFSAFVQIGTSESDAAKLADEAVGIEKAAENSGLIGAA